MNVFAEKIKKITLSDFVLKFVGIFLLICFFLLIFFVAANLEQSRDVVKDWTAFTAISSIIGLLALWFLAFVSEKLNLDKIFNPAFSFLIIVGILNWLLCIVFMVAVGLVSIVS